MLQLLGTDAAWSTSRVRARTAETRRRMRQHLGEGRARVTQHVPELYHPLR